MVKKSGEKTVLVKTQARFLRISPRKLRVVVRAVKGLTPSQAVLRLGVWNRKGARLLLKVLKAAIANAENNFSLEKEKLRFKEILVNEGARLKRTDRSHGARFASGLKMHRLAHLRIIISGSKKE